MNKYIVFSFVCLIYLCACRGDAKEGEVSQENSLDIVSNHHPKLVLAQWTFHKALFSGEMSSVDFVNIAAELGFEGVEFVNQFFDDKIDDDKYFKSLREASEKAGIKNTLLVIDVHDKRLGSSDPVVRSESIQIHKKWIEAAYKLGCPNVRINAHGDGTSDQVGKRISESVIELSRFGKKYRVGINIENHGQYSSDGKWLSSLLEDLVPYGVGSVADFDNWCIAREGGSLWGTPCINEYDRYQGVKELLPTAKSVSLKAFAFDENGDEIETDFKRMFDLIKSAQYDEYLAVEFEGVNMDPLEGIQKTLDLLEKYY